MKIKTKREVSLDSTIYTVGDTKIEVKWEGDGWVIVSDGWTSHRLHAAEVPERLQKLIGYIVIQTLARNS